MLYPDFNELVSYKDLKLDLKQPSCRLSHSTVLGTRNSPFRGQGLEFDSVREYVPGDDIRNIDWRVTARTGFPHLKIFQEERQRNLVLCIDMNAGMRFGTKSTFKSVQAARIAALLGWQGMAHHDKITACLYGDVPGGIEFFTPKHSRTSFSLLLKRLSEPAVKQRPVPLKEALQHLAQTAHTGSLIYFISDFMQMEKNSEEEMFLSSLKKRCDGVFISVNDRADRSLFSVGRLGFQGNASEKLMINTDSLAGREAYALQWKESRQKLYGMASRFKMPLIELTTESDIKKDLLFALKTMIKGGKR